MNYKLSKLVLIPTKKPSTTAEVFISNPQIDEEAILGKLFILCEVESTKAAALKIINFLISALPANYYQNEKISLKQKMGAINVGEIFEQALMKTNEEFANFLKSQKIKINAKELNVAAGVIVKNNCYFSSIGKIKSFLVYSEKTPAGPSIETEDENSPAKKIYKVVNVEEQEKNTRVNIGKIFSYVTEGKIPPEGYFLFANEIFPEYISHKQLIKIITTLPPASAVEQIKSQLHKINSYVTFLALLIKNSRQIETKKVIPTFGQGPTEVSLEKIRETEAQTSRYLSPAGVISPDKYTGLLKSVWHKIFKPKPRGQLSQIRDKVFFQKKSRTLFSRRTANLIRAIVAYFINSIVYLLSFLIHPKKSFFKLKKLTYKIKLSLFKAWRWFFSLSMLSKAVFIAAAVCLFLFAYSIYQMQAKKITEIKTQEYEQTLQLIEQKQNQIEASLLYNNEEKALVLVNEVDGLLAEISGYKNIDQNLIDKFRQKNNEQMEKLSRVNKLELTEIANFIHLSQNVDPRQIFMLNKNIIALDIKNNVIYKYSSDDNTINILSEELGNIDQGALANDNLLLISPNKRTVIDQEEKISSIDIGLYDQAGEVTAISYYNNRLYLLSAAQNELYRYSRDYQIKEGWIKEDIDIKNSVSLAIDGYIYILKSSGEVLKFLSGYSQEFELAAVNPPFASAAKIKVSDEERGFIYILEPANKRLVVFNKEGKFIVQYKMENLNNLRDFIVLEEDKKILFLDGSAVYEAEAQHFE